MEPIKVYAIRQVSTGWFMPATAPQRHRQRGYTRDEPTEGCVPRLFLKRQYAELALRAWLQGYWQPRVVEYAPGDFDEVMDIVEVEGRRADDMEIVELWLIDELAYSE